MTKKYRTKIATPWCAKDSIHEADEAGNITCFSGGSVDPTNYPELFELVVNIEKLTDWINKYLFCYEPERIKAKIIAQAIINTGVDVSKLIVGIE